MNEIKPLLHSALYTARAAAVADLNRHLRLWCWADGVVHAVAARMTALFQ